MSKLSQSFFLPFSSCSYYYSVGPNTTVLLTDNSNDGPDGGSFLETHCVHLRETDLPVTLAGYTIVMSVTPAGRAAMLQSSGNFHSFFLIRLLFSQINSSPDYHASPLFGRYYLSLFCLYNFSSQRLFFIFLVAELCLIPTTVTW